MEENTASDEIMFEGEPLELGDQLTQDGLMVCEVVSLDATLGMSDGLEVQKVDPDLDDDPVWISELQLSVHWTRCEVTA